MRLGNWHRSVTVVGVAALTLLAAGPATAATRNNRDHGRNPNNDKSTHRDPNADQSSRRQYGDPSGDTGFPAEFVAELNGRIVVVAAANGRIVRRLTPEAPGGGASGPAVGPGGRTVWFSRGDGSCASHIAFVPAAGGPERSLPGSGEDGPESTPLPRPGHDQLAYARGDCHGATGTLVVGDLQGLRAHGQSGLVPLAWSRDGDHLLARASDHDELHLLDIAGSGAITDDRVLAVTDRAADCRLQVLGFSPDDNGGYVATRHCGPSSGEARRSLVLLGRDARVASTVLRLPRGQDFVGSPVFDPKGHSLLYATAPVEAAGTRNGNGSDDVSLWLWRDGDLSRLARPSHYGDPAWLP
ncbi:MAG TPA: hypothetical protein VGO87_08145 [Acidimicrobiia bacterium]